METLDRTQASNTSITLEESAYCDYLLRWRDANGINVALTDSFVSAMTLAISLQHAQQSHTTIHSIDGMLRYANPLNNNNVLKELEI